MVPRFLPLRSNHVSRVFPPPLPPLPSSPGDTFSVPDLRGSGVNWPGLEARRDSARRGLRTSTRPAEGTVNTGEDPTLPPGAMPPAGPPPDARRPRSRVEERPTLPAAPREPAPTPEPTTPPPPRVLGEPVEPPPATPPPPPPPSR